MQLSQINLNHIRVFEVVYRTKSMTAAATELHLTQSGVSQHVATLEAQLGVKLFDRVKKRLVHTSDAEELYLACAHGLTQIQDGLAALSGGNEKLSGWVRVGMPIEFGNNQVLARLGKFSLKHPLVQFKIVYDYASVMNEQLLTGALDCAFVDDFAMDQSIQVEEIYEEILEMVVQKNLWQKLTQAQASSKKSQVSFLTDLDFVDYQIDAPLATRWIRHHFKPKHVSLRVKACVMDVKGVSRLVQEGLGLGVIPRHVLEQSARLNATVQVVEGGPKPLKNPISLAVVKGRTQSRASQALIQFMKESFSQEKLQEKQSEKPQERSAPKKNS